MKILVTVLVTALFVFALATAWVDYVQPHLEQVARTEAAKAAAIIEPAAPKKRIRKARVSEELDLLPVPADGDSSEVAESPPRAAKSAAQREMTSQLTEKLEEVKRKEADLATRQESLRMIYDDIRTELAVVDEIRKRANDDLAQAERRMFDTAQPKRSQPPKMSRTPSSPKVASEPPAIRAEAMFIRHLVDEGKMETAISLLKAMKGRDAVGVLGVLDSVDSKLADQLAARVQADMSETVRR